MHQLHRKLENDDFGIRFGLFLHFEMRLTTANKVQQIVEAACKEFLPVDRYTSATSSSLQYSHSRYTVVTRVHIMSMLMMR